MYIYSKYNKNALPGPLSYGYPMGMVWLSYGIVRYWSDFESGLLQCRCSSFRVQRYGKFLKCANKNGFRPQVEAAVQALLAEEPYKYWDPFIERGDVEASPEM